MKIDSFKSFDLYSKACITWKNGVHIGCRAQGYYYMSLYKLDDFYVEIHYHTCYDGIASVQTFVCEDELQPYLEQIDITKIFS